MSSHLYDTENTKTRVDVDGHTVDVEISGGSYSWDGGFEEFETSFVLTVEQAHLLAKQLTAAATLAASNLEYAE